MQLVDVLWYGCNNPMPVTEGRGTNNKEWMYMVEIPFDVRLSLTA